MPASTQGLVRRKIVILLAAVLVVIAPFGLYLLRSPSFNSVSDSAAPINAAMEAYDRGDYMPAEPILRYWADKGHPVAQFGLGRMYGSGRGLERNPTEAARLYRLAVRQNEPRAMINLGILLRNGDGVRQNLPEAIHLFRQAARYGDYLGSVHLGLLHEEGLGLYKSDESAIEFYRVAARHGEPTGKYRLGRMHHEGRGTLPSLDIAISLYREAAAQGHSASIRMLENLGVPVDPANEVQLSVERMPGEVPLTRSRETLYVQGNVAGVENITFVLDSAASLVSIPARLIERLRHEGILQEHHFRGQVQFTGWDGGLTMRETFILPSLIIGDQKVENVMAVESRFRDTSLLGLSFLGTFKSWSINNERNTLMLVPR